MNLTICYLGLLAERRGLAEEKIDTSASDPAAVYAEQDAQHGLGLAITDLRVAVNDEFVSFQHPLNANDTLAFLPPMSGG